VPTSEKVVSCTLLSDRGSVSAKLKHEPELFEMVGGAEPQESGGREAYGKLIGSLVKRTELRKRMKRVISDSRESYGAPAAPMAGDLAKAAEVIMRSFISGAPIMVRFHCDGDGVAGAVALYRALDNVVKSGLSGERQVSWQPNKEVFYTKEAFYSDRLLFSSYRSAERPLLVIIDFGTHIDSNEPIALAEKLCEVVWIDHHTLPEGFDSGKRSVYINPFRYGSDSRLSAGLVASLISQAIGAECRDLMEAALISDHSACADYGNVQARKAALVLDYMITRRDSDSSSLRKIDALISDRTRLEEAYSKIGGMMEEAVSAGSTVMKRYKTSEGIGVYVIDFRKVKSGDYPAPGRFSSEMQYHLEETTGKPAITAVYFGNYISVRVSKSISGKVDLIGIIARIGEESAGVVTGGGHREAASIKSGSLDTIKVVGMLLDCLGVVG
jgi:RecJ-like exonuclease